MHAEYGSSAGNPSPSYHTFLHVSKSAVRCPCSIKTQYLQNIVSVSLCRHKRLQATERRSLARSLQPPHIAQSHSLCPTVSSTLTPRYVRTNTQPQLCHPGTPVQHTFSSPLLRVRWTRDRNPTLHPRFAPARTLSHPVSSPQGGRPGPKFNSKSNHRRHIMSNDDSATPTRRPRIRISGCPGGNSAVQHTFQTACCLPSSS
ncbi:hypothetical protein LX36DRAFT_658172 [Colletotrichum falcatum]|nr:hypothetical protein LX36DRAFT_658172 [Colletotrichum falcatum]